MLTAEQKHKIVSNQGIKYFWRNVHVLLTSTCVFGDAISDSMGVVKTKRANTGGQKYVLG